MAAPKIVQAIHVNEEGNILFPSKDEVTAQLFSNTINASVF